MASKVRKLQLVPDYSPAAIQKRRDRHADIWMDINLDLDLLFAMIDLAAYVENEEQDDKTISDHGPVLPLVLADIATAPTRSRTRSRSTRKTLDTRVRQAFMSKD